MKKTKFVLIAVFVIAILASIYGTYARYSTKNKMKAELEVAKWLVKVNSTDITTEESKVFTISDVDFTENENVRTGKFAPGSEMTFTIGIDGSESMVSMEYFVDIDLSNFENENITSTVESSNGRVINDEGSSIYSGKLRYSEGDLSTILTVTIKWLDNEDHLEEDKELGSVYDNSISIPVNVTVKQYMEA